MVNSVDNVKSWIGNDLKRHDQCTVDDLLQYFLVRCQSTTNKSEGAKLLQDCKAAVLCVCSDADIRDNLTQ